MKRILTLIGVIILVNTVWSQKIVDVHLHGSESPSEQIRALQNAGVYKVALSTSWDLQNTYRNTEKMDFLFGFMFPCPNGKVPYSLQDCYPNGEEWPSVDWVEQQIKSGKIDFLGEVLNQYYGISPSDSLLFPYFRLAEKYHLPVGIHTGGAGPNHGSPNFKMEMGNPNLLKPILSVFPNLKIWIMHAGDQYYLETIDIMKAYEGVYADISVISNPDIISFERFKIIMKTFLEAGMEDRLMFGTDNGNVENVVKNIEELDFLSNSQKKKLYYKNAERFFRKSKK
ncbi:MAG TPA: amidohydrolase family protein [Moheibacter sp.]|nr:amidohydrolase family protein [Moheibacter sp.]